MDKISGICVLLLWLSVFVVASIGAHAIAWAVGGVFALISLPALIFIFR